MIKNLTKKTLLIKNSIFIDDIFSKFVGLMLSKQQKKALIFRFEKERIISLHMFFVFYPIDVLFLDKSKIVVDKKESFKPFTFYKPKKKAMYAVEMPAGIIKRTKTGIGDKIEF